MSSVLVHVTDFHVYSDEAKTNGGVVPAKTLRKVLAAAKKEIPSPQALILTGDFTNDDSEASYKLARSMIRDSYPQPTPVLFVPGNHEDLPVLESVFIPEFTGPGGGKPVEAADVGPWRVLLVSSFVKGQVSGLLTDAAVAALDSELAACGAAGRPALVALHHPPVPPAGFDAPPWGQECLREPERLYDLLSRHGQARVVLHGHLHTDLHRRVGNADIYCTPSTCHQTKQVSPQWEKEPDGLPGFRVLRLQPDGSHTTEVHLVDISDCLAPE